MDHYMNTVITGLMIPFIGTAAGAGCVFFLKKDLKTGIQRALTGFAAGVMVAASIWSLLVPAMEASESMGRLAFLPAFTGFWCGILFLLFLDHVIPHIHRSIEKADQTEGPKSRLTRTAMLVLAVTLHNIPEGMAVGVVYAGLVNGSGSITAGSRISSILRVPIRQEVHLHLLLVSRYRIFRRGPLYPCPCMQRGRISLNPSCWEYCPVLLNRCSELLPYCLRDLWYLPCRTFFPLPQARCSMWWWRN